MNTSVRNIGLFLLVMLITGSIDSIRNLPTTALFGASLVFFFIFAAIVFLIPAGLVSAELSSAWTEQGGIYDWVRMAFGEKVAVIAVWLQWINTMVWYPTILSFIAGVLAYLIDPELAKNKVYLVSVILIVFWVMTFINFKGVKASARFASFCALFGMVIPMILIMVLGLVWLFKGNPVQIQFTAQSMLPHLGQGQSWISLTAIMTAFLGMELATVHVRSVANPQRVFPKALFISVIFILFTMIMGSLAIAVVLPHDEINLVDGIMQAFGAFLSEYHLKPLLPVLTALLLLGSLGGMINWIISPAKGLMRVAQHGYLPKWLAKESDNGVAKPILIIQAVMVSFICLAFLLMPSVNGSYWLLTDLSTQLYMLMYVFMFIAALALRYKYATRERPFKIPFGNFGMWVVTLLGLFGCVLTLIVGFIPPESIDVGGKTHYEIIFTGGIIVMILPVVFLYLYRYLTHKKVV
jgi:glutamate:GABA antiporter